MARQKPRRRDLNTAILWCARWLLGDGRLYRGEIEVQIRAPSHGGHEIIQPVKGADGLELPTALVGIPPGTPSGLELLKVLLSEDEKTILRAVVEHPKALVKTIQDAAKVGSGFYVLWSNLKSRGLVVPAEHGEGFDLGVGWLLAIMLEPDQHARPRLAADSE